MEWKWNYGIGKVRSSNFFFLDHYHNFVRFVRNNSDNRCLFRIIWLKFDNIACPLVPTSSLTRILLLFFKFTGSLLTASPRKFLLRGSTHSMHYLNRSGNWNEMNTTLDTNENLVSILGNTEQSKSVLKIYLYSLLIFIIVLNWNKHCKITNKFQSNCKKFLTQPKKPLPTKINSHQVSTVELF